MSKNGSLILLSLTALVTLCCGASVYNPDAKTDVESRIFRGKPAARGQFPYYVLVRAILTNGASDDCGGSLIHRNWVLTAAQCVRRHETLIDRFELHFGAFNRTDVHEKGRLVLSPKRSYVHPNYSATEGYHNTALFKLDKPIEFNAYIQPVNLPKNELKPLARVTAIGLGEVSPEGKLHDVLHFTVMTHIPQEECVKVYPFLVDREDQFCATGNDRSSPCAREDGGPLVVQTREGATLFGMIGLTHLKGCHLGHSARFTSVYYDLDWINEIMS